MPERILKISEAIKEATDQMMDTDKSVYVIGLGVSYKNGADGTTAGLKVKYPNRVFDVPVSEAAFTGMAVGSAINGLRPIIHHGRVEFALFAADQIFTQAAKWNYMFGGNNPVPAVFRISIGRQWGNGPQHTQALYSLFGNVTGLKVVIPTTPYMAKGLLVSALQNNSPVVILESRWLYNIKQDVLPEIYSVPLDKARVVKKGGDITVVAYGDGYVTTSQAIDLVKDYANIELIDLVSINPIDYSTILDSVRKTKRLLCVDTTNEAFNVGSEVISHVVKNANFELKSKPVNMSCPNVPCPTSTSLTEGYYPNKVSIANSILEALSIKKKIDQTLTFEELHIAPNFVINEKYE